MAKRIAVGGGYEVEFVQRARGEETPYWQGRVYKDGSVVGDFRNDGRGGATLIHPPDLVVAFQKLVDEAAPDVNPATMFEREALVIWYAELIGYYKSAAGMVLADVVREFAKERAPGERSGRRG